MEQNIIQNYHNAARKFAATYAREVSEHIIHVIASLMMTRDGVIRSGGSFVHAVLDNNLYDAVIRADNEVLKEIKLITLAKHDAFLEQKYQLSNDD